MPQLFLHGEQWTILGNFQPTIVIKSPASNAKTGKAVLVTTVQGHAVIEFGSGREEKA